MIFKSTEKKNYPDPLFNSFDLIIGGDINAETPGEFQIYYGIMPFNFIYEKRWIC